MSENPVQHLLQAFNCISQCIQAQLSRFILRSNQPSASPNNKDTPLKSLASHSTGALHPLRPDEIPQKQKPSGPMTKEELGRATWTFLHTLAAQYPDKPTRQQKKDIKELMAILSRIYPCKECADHFREVLMLDLMMNSPVGCVTCIMLLTEGKLNFPCNRVDARWGKLECENRACDLQGAAPMDVADDVRNIR